MEYPLPKIAIADFSFSTKRTSAIIILSHDNLSTATYEWLPLFTSICISSLQAMLADWKRRLTPWFSMYWFRAECRNYHHIFLWYNIAKIKYDDRQLNNQKTASYLRGKIFVLNIVTGTVIFFAFLKKKPWHFIKLLALSL